MAYEKIKATASVTIVDETDASTLIGNMTVVSGSKNQIYLTGQANPFSPNWAKSNLVIRPFLQATNVTKNNLVDVEYNPDLFNPEEYPNALSSYGYIKDIHWYLRDSAGVETEIHESSDYSLSYTYVINDKRVVCSDHRQLVIKNNILNKNSTADVVCKFSFFDPFANMYISQQLECNLINIASGQSNSRLVTTCVNGNSINNNIAYIDIMAQFYGNEGEEDIGAAIEEGSANTSCLWYIRRLDGWVLLDPTSEGQSNANSDANMYEIMAIDSYDNVTGVYKFSKYEGGKGNAGIRIYPALIKNSEVIKCVYTDSTGAKYNSIQVVYDTTDETRVELYCSNGKRLRKGRVEDTIIKAMVTYKGTLLEDDSPLYNTEFDYYWYKYTLSDDKYVNVFNNTVNDLIENEDLANPVKGLRSLYIDYLDISAEEKEAEITLDLVEFGAIAAEAAQASYFSNAITEEDLGIAMLLNDDIGEENIEAAIYTAQELNLEDE